MTPIRLILLGVGLPTLLATSYLAVLTLLARPRRVAAPARSGRRFRVVVPAHNEAAGIGATLENLCRLEYPAADWELVVVADNCDDATAVVAASHGARVLERHDAERQGKGYAIAFAIDTLLREPASAWDALVVVDADSDVSPNLLHAFAAHLETGVLAVQATYLPRTGGRGTLAVVTEVAFTAFHIVRSQARERLGLSCGLRGNGMGFARSLLETVPHDAFSLAEDVEFGVRLGVEGIRVGYVEDALVRGDMPDHQRAAHRQRTRWIGGRMQLAKRWLPALLGAAYRRDGRIALDLAADLLVPPVSVLGLVSAAGLAVAVGDAAVAGNVTLALVLWLATAAALALHVGDAARRAGQVQGLARAATALPGYAIDKFLIIARSIVAPDTTWIRTTRTGEHS